MSKKHERPVGLFTLVQVMGMCAIAIIGAALVVFIGGLISDLIVYDVHMTEGLWSLVKLLCIPCAGVCLLWLLVEFVLMCGRVRRETAFTAVNARALGRIALAFFLGGMLLIPCGGLIMDVLLLGMRGTTSPVWMGLPTFAAWTAALMVRAIQVLLRRAVDMQTEADLTV